jgi:hypothetical protein
MWELQGRRGAGSGLGTSAQSALVWNGLRLPHRGVVPHVIYLDAALTLTGRAVSVTGSAHVMEELIPAHATTPARTRTIRATAISTDRKTGRGELRVNA